MVGFEGPQRVRGTIRAMLGLHTYRYASYGILIEYHLTYITWHYVALFGITWQHLALCGSIRH